MWKVIRKWKTQNLNSKHFYFITVVLQPNIGFCMSTKTRSVNFVQRYTNSRFVSRYPTICQTVDIMCCTNNTLVLKAHKLLQFLFVFLNWGINLVVSWSIPITWQNCLKFFLFSHFFQWLTEWVSHFFSIHFWKFAYLYLISRLERNSTKLCHFRVPENLWNLKWEKFILLKNSSIDSAYVTLITKMSIADFKASKIQLWNV